jgi:predicted Zn-dependent peptidase
MFAGHPLGSPIIGTPESLGAIDRQSLLAQRDRLWGGANLVLTVVGRIHPDRALELATNYFEGQPAGAPNERLDPPAVGPQHPQTITGQAGQQQAQFRLGFSAPGALHEDRYAMTVLNAILGGGDGRLFEELRSNRGVAYAAGSSYQPYSDAGAWYAAAGVDPANLDAAVAVTRAELERLRAEVPPEDEVARRVSQIAGREILASETNAARASQLAGRELLGTEPAEEFVRRVRDVTPEDVQRVANTYLDLDRSLLVSVAPRR